MDIRVRDMGKLNKIDLMSLAICVCISYIGMKRRIERKKSTSCSILDRFDVVRLSDEPEIDFDHLLSAQEMPTT